MSMLKALRGSCRGIHLTVLGALVAVVSGLVYYELPGTDRSHGQAGLRDVAADVSTMYDHKPTLLVVGDSFAVTYPEVVADAMGWNLALDAQPGTGFVHGVPPYKPFVDRLDRDAAIYRVDYVLLDGGRSDGGESPEQVAAAAEEYIKKVQSHWPKAKIIVALPAYATPDVEANYPAAAEGLRRVAEGAGAYVIDPEAQRWYSDVDVKPLLLQDGVDLNFYGQLYYARKIVENLKQMFPDKPTLLVVSDADAGGVDSRTVAYPQLVADKMGWNLALDAQGGTGFIHGVDDAPPPHRPFIDRLDRDAAIYQHHVDYVLVDGGRNDLGESPELVVAAAGEYVKGVQSHWPDAKIIIMLPAYATPDAPANYLPVAEGLGRMAESVGAHVIDPGAQRWYRNAEAKPVTRLDAVDLNGDDQTYYANKIVEDLKPLFPEKPTLLVVGDSYAGGVDPRTVNYPQLVADKMGWNLALDAQGGTGFIHGIDNVSPPHLRFIDRLDHDAETYRYQVDCVLIDGGRNDLGEPPERLVAAAGEYIKQVHSDWPNAKIVIIVPTYATPDVAASYPAVAEGLRRAAESVGAYVIDPVAQRWYRDVDVKPLLWRDGVHLNSDGETYYAGKITENLKQMGLAS